MEKEVFISLMENEEYKFLGKPDVSNGASDDPNFNWKKRASQNEFKRGICMIFATDEEIADIKESEFNDWYKEHSKYYHFNKDWKKKFKGSEFLIPVVEEEIGIRLRMQDGDFHGKLRGIKEGTYDMDEVIAEYKSKAERQS